VFGTSAIRRVQTVNAARPEQALARQEFEREIEGQRA
jgi:hypothetical protein